MKPEIIRTEKKCSRCKDIQPITNFSKSRASIDGHVYHCKNCEKKVREIRKKKPDIIAFDYYE